MWPFLKNMLMLSVLQKGKGVGKDIIGAGGIEGKKKDDETTVNVSTQPTPLEEAETAALAPAKDLIEKAISSNLDEKEGIVSDAEKKQFIDELRKKYDADEEITDEDLGKLSKHVNRYNTSKKALPKDLAPLAEEDRFPRKEKEEVPGSSMEEVNRQLGLASKGHLFGQLIGGLIGAVGGAGGIGSQEKFGVSPTKIAGTISDLSSRAYLERKREISRNIRAEQEAITEKRIDAIRNMGLPPQDEAIQVAAERRTLETKLGRINQTLGLGVGEV